MKGYFFNRPFASRKRQSVTTAGNENRLVGTRNEKEEEESENVLFKIRKSNKMMVL